MSTERYVRSSQFAVTLKVGARDYGTWKQLEGGAVSSEATVRKPGGMKPPVVVPGGTPTTETVTLTKDFSLEDATDAFHALKAAVGRGDIATAGQQTLDYAGLPFGKPLVYAGAVTSVTPPQADSESDDVASIQVVIQPAG